MNLSPDGFIVKDVMESKPNILVTGANGQLGRSLRQLADSFPSFTFSFLSHDDLPVHQLEKLKLYFTTHKPACLVNCAAYTAVDKAETEKDLAYQVNAEAAGMLASVCKEYGCRFIHISTDYVFDGHASVPYTEEAITNPQSVYGASKLEGEKLALQNNPETLIIRTSWVYSGYGKNFVKTMLRLMAEKEEINVVNDQLGSPTYAVDLAAVILQILGSANWQPGIYHYCNEGIISWYDFAIAIKEMTASGCRVNPIPTTQYPAPAKRPAYSALDNTKIRVTFGIAPTLWKNSLHTCLKGLLHG